MSWQEKPRPKPSRMISPHARNLGFGARRKAVSRTSIFLCGSVCGNTKLPEEKAKPVGELLNGLVDRAAAGVAGLGIVKEQDGVIRTVGGLKARGHFAGVQRRNAGVAIAGDEECCGIFRGID